MHISTVYYSQTVETSQKSINRLMDKQNVECVCVCARAPVHLVEYHATVKRNGVLLYATM